MQWLFNLVTAIVSANFGFVFRGDNPSWDFTGGDLVIDNAWHKLDLSAIVPENAVAVLLKVNLKATIAGKKFDLQRGDQLLAINTCALWTQVPDLTIGGVFVIPCTEGRWIRYKANVATWNTLNLNVNGWWLRTQP